MKRRKRVDPPPLVELRGWVRNGVGMRSILELSPEEAQAVVRELGSTENDTLEKLRRVLEEELAHRAEAQREQLAAVTDYPIGFGASDREKN